MNLGRYGRSWQVLLMCLCVPLSQANSARGGESRQPTSHELLGAWRLVRIELSGPSGPIVDPFYQAGSTGIIIYDSSGWMSVQIVAPQRPPFAVPASRSSPAASAQDAPLKAAAFDTYYAYFGTWDYDEATSVVTHHVKSALIPAETGLSYAQEISFERGRMIFTVRSGNKREEIVCRKIWERIPGTGT